MTEQTGVKVQSLTHWAIPVNDLEESRRFYTQILGMDDRGPVGDRMRCVGFGETQVLLCKRGQAPPPGYREPIHLAFRVSDADLERAAIDMREWGVDVQPPANADEMRGDVEYRREGVFVGRSLYFNDPSGNRLELHAPGFPKES